MPLSAGLQRAVDSVNVPGLDAALETANITETLQLLASRSSFASPGVPDDIQLGQLRDDLRRVREEDTPIDRPCGALQSLPPDHTALPTMRLLIYATRREYRLEEQQLLLAASAPAVPRPPLPPPPSQRLMIPNHFLLKTSRRCMQLPSLFRMAQYGCHQSLASVTL